MSYKSGDIVLAKYKKFTGEIDKGIFYIIYSESEYIKRRDNIKFNIANNYILCKISSNKAMSFSMPIETDECKFLQHESFINLSKLHTVNDDEILVKIGIANNAVRDRVLLDLSELLHELLCQTTNDNIQMNINIGEQIEMR